MTNDPPDQDNASLDAQLNEAVEHHRAGRLFEAEEIYRRILAVEPDYPYALCLLGGIAQAVEEYDQAVDLISRAIAVKPDYIDAHINMSGVLLSMARFEEALASLEQALALNPDSATAHFNKGVILNNLDRLDDAVASYRRAIAIKPDFAEAHYNLGNTLTELKQTDDALASFQKAIEIKPDHAGAHNNLGNLYRDLDRMEEAVENYRRAIEIRPDFAEAHTSLGIAWKDMGRFEEAAASHRQALALNPEYAEASSNLGNALRELGRLEDAAASLEEAIRLKPDLAEAHSNLGAVLRDMGRLKDAAASYRKALAVAPDYAEAHLNLGLVHLLAGDFDNGWREYDWRWRRQDFSSQHAEKDKPLWDGSPISGKRLLVWSEQGIGDEIMFASLIPDLIERDIDVILECDPRLVPLFARSFPPVTCIAKGGSNQPFDFHIPTGGLGRLFRRKIELFPKPAPYLVADPELRTELRDRYHNQGAGALVGLAWHSASPDGGRQSSLTLLELHPLLETPEVNFVNLQYGDTADQRSAFARETGIDIFHDDQVDQMVSMDAFASQVAAMDLIVSIDNSATQLAGALGVPTWGLLRAVPYWCWGLDREDSYWHPGMRLFRQDTPGDWNGVIERVCVALGEWSGSSRN